MEQPTAILAEPIHHLAKDPAKWRMIYQNHKIRIQKKRLQKYPILIKESNFLESNLFLMNRWKTLMRKWILQVKVIMNIKNLEEKDKILLVKVLIKMILGILDLKKKLVNKIKKKKNSAFIII